MIQGILRPLTCPTLEAWEVAGTELSASLDHYVNLSQRLFATALDKDMHSLILADRIDNALNFMHDMLDRQLALSRSALARARNSLMFPAYCLPDELLHEIFINVLYPVDESSLGESMDSALRRIIPLLFSLIRVCRVWWDVILKGSDFSSSLPLYIDHDLCCLRAPAPGVLRAKEPLHLAAVVKKDVHPINWKIAVSMMAIPRIRTVNISTSEAPIQLAIHDIIVQFSRFNASSLALKKLSLHHTQDLLDQVSVPIGFEWTIHDVWSV
ncbi:hypothetical protein B0J17DRAFT_153613 [Rhizoctonia solani]|nr:hypothetical protein B0J17DRAFT_153613 [Rhizoctonia solani]